LAIETIIKTKTMYKTATIIKENRKSIGLKQEDLADKLDITASYLSLIENGKREPSLKLRKKISKHLKIPLSLLVLTDIHDLASNKHEKEIEKMIKEIYEQTYKQA
jgi:transcriptional regulator with XRE-family HTH domain